jgi:hypothetical protein
VYKVPTILTSTIVKAGLTGSAFGSSRNQHGNQICRKEGYLKMETVPSKGHRVSPNDLLMPALAMTISQLLCGDFVVAAVNICT